MRLDHIPRRLFTATTAARDGKMRLHFAQRAGATVHDFADLAIGDCAADADVHDGCFRKKGFAEK
jgi:hypothetical protein